MKKLLSISLLIFLISCANEPKKEKFSYDRVQTEKKIKTNDNGLVLNSNDQMLFDKGLLNFLRTFWKFQKFPKKNTVSE